MMMNDNFFDFFFFGCGTGSKKSISDQYKISKRWAGLNIFYGLLSILMGRFIYDLPEGMDARFFELTLLAQGSNLTCRDKSGELGNYYIGYGNKFNKYGYYNNAQAMDFMGLSHGNYIPNCPGNIEPDAVITYDNLINTPPIMRIKWYADRLTDIQGSINACLANLKGCVIIRCSKEQEPAVRRAWSNANDGSPVIISFAPGEGGFDIEPEIITNPQTGEILKELQESFDKYLSMFLSEYGINSNGVINKMSGVGDQELKQNDQMRQLNLDQSFRMRQKGIDEINEMFGVQASVKLAKPLETPEPKDNKDDDFNEEEDFADENI